VNNVSNPISKPEENGQLNILITRPKEKAKQLALLLDQQGIANISQPLFDYQNNTSEHEVTTALSQANIAIFVSVAAVEFAYRNYPFTDNKKIVFIAVGQATKSALLAVGIKDISVPTQENSEGVLLLPSLQKVHNKNVVIFRGNGGREHIATKLNQRGAHICYIESYQRVWRTLSKNISQQWQAQQINCIVVTSNDNLMALMTMLQGSEDTLPTYWQHNCLWLVVSSRIENNAKALGLTKIINSGGANITVLAETIKALDTNININAVIKQK
tara:strand:- start:177 stop:995 length:819 start_codon:yes stop_codon:yes gene_type:complete